MKTLRIDSVGGASGDMLLGLMVDLGVDVARLETTLSQLPIEGFRLEAEQATERGLNGTRVTVTVEDEPHPHRGLADVCAVIEQGALPQRAQAMAIRVFERLADAEAAVHGTTRDTIHFHEVGAMDAILDIVGTCLSLEWLGIERVQVGPLPVGQGTTDAAHGVLPLPVPAVAELLKGHELLATDEPFELVTPTGAALLTTWMSTGKAQGRVVATGYGVGQRQLSSRANVIRGVLLEAVAREAGEASCHVMECNLDDMTPELCGALVEALLDAGALDAYVTPVSMKKQRPGFVVTALCDMTHYEAVRDAFFRNSTTLGLREYRVDRTCLPRRFDVVATPWGEVRVKIASWRGDDITRAPEYEDCVKLAHTAKVTVRQVYEAACAYQR